MKIDQSLKCNLYIDSSCSKSPGMVFAEITTDSSMLLSSPINIGYNSCPVWARVSFTTKTSEDIVIRLMHSLLDSVDVFIKDSLNFSLYTSCGLLEQKKSPSIQDFYPCFIVPKELTSKIFLIRIKTSDVCAIDLEATDRSTFDKQSKSANVFFGLYLGAVFVLASINFFLFIWAKFTSSLWYSLYILMFASFQIVALGFVELRYVFNNTFFLQNATPFFANLCIVFSSLFIIDFLVLRANSLLCNILKNIFLLFIIVGIALAVLAISGYGTTSSMLASAIAPFYLFACLVIGIIRIRKIGLPSIFYTASILVIMSTIFVNSLRNFGIVPNTFFASHANIIGSVFEFMIIAVALVERVSSIEKKKLEAIQETQKANQLVAENRLKALQAQINPHFLFNTLNTLAELIRIFPEKAEQLTISLSKFFRYTLEASEKKMSTLDVEIDIIKNYLRIEKMRFGDRLHFEINYDNHFSDIKMPALLIQPIVENSVKHGISVLPEGGRITIDVCKLQDSIHLSIHDNGPGFNSDLKTDSTSHGLYSIKERLRLLYGDKAHLSLKNVKGALVELVIPF